jgi:hypothetical protein
MLLLLLSIEKSIFIVNIISSMSLRKNIPWSHLFDPVTKQPHSSFVQMVNGYLACIRLDHFTLVNMRYRLSASACN